jgi:two-component sensor histidine kinase/ActR/RegA family two-component response regulator
MTDIELKETILVIDDESAIRNSYRDYLEDLGYKVFSAENGKVGLQIFEKKDIDLIVADLRMPEMDGLEVLKVVTNESPGTPIIVVSGTGVIDDVVEALHLGAWDYLLKPVEDLQVFKHAVENALVTARLKIENRKYRNDLEDLVLKRTSELEDEVGKRRKVEVEIRKALQEKEILLQEIHHRVKNNMAIISAFISLKEQSESDAVVINTFQNLQQRIKTMALVHEKLYQSDNFEKINVKGYCSDLCYDLVNTYNTSAIPVKCELDVMDLYFTLDVLIPIGLVINEIIMNSLKHAFNGIDLPVISVKLDFKNESDVILQIADNGCGYDNSEVSVEDGHLGIEIVKALVLQLHGSIEIKTVNRAKYIIEFPIIQK